MGSRGSNFNNCQETQEGSELLVRKLLRGVPTFKQLASLCFLERDMTVWTRRFGVLAIVLGAFFPLVGCDREVMEVDTPTGEVEVEEELDGDLEIESD